MGTVPSDADPSPAAATTSRNLSAAEVTRLLNDACAGKSHGNANANGSAGASSSSASSASSSAAAQLLPVVYRELRVLAARKLRSERGDHTLQATALVHEAYLRLVDTTKIQSWDSRWHFFAAAAQAMRRILVEGARRRSRLKRGGDRGQVDLNTLDLPVHARADELIALDEALTRLAAAHPDKARLVDLRYFAGLTNEEAAAALEISTSTADRHWAYAKAWLYREMSKS
jgi:RNA polymerase sigma factor (TIGR02999 family)